MNGQFLVSRGGRDVFLNEDELRREARRGLLALADRVFHPVLGRWLYAKEVAEVEAELLHAAKLGRTAPPESVVLVPVNGPAVAGLLLGSLGYIPFVGLVLSGLGVYFSSRGLSLAPQRFGSGHRLAVAGMLLSLLCFVPQLALAVLLFAH